MSRASKAPPIGLRPMAVAGDELRADTKRANDDHALHLTQLATDWRHARRVEIVEAIARYTLAQVAVPKDWADELIQLNTEFK